MNEEQRLDELKLATKGRQYLTDNGYVGDDEASLIQTIDDLISWANDFVCFDHLTQWAELEDRQLYDALIAKVNQ